MIVSCVLMTGIMYIRPMLIEKYLIFINGAFIINTIVLISGILMVTIFEEKVRNKYNRIVDETIKISARLREIV